MVKAEANGRQQILSVKIDPECVDPDDVEMLEDLVLAAVSDALEKSAAAAADAMQGPMGGMDLGGIDLDSLGIDLDGLGLGSGGPWRPEFGSPAWRWRCNQGPSNRAGRRRVQRDLICSKDRFKTS